MKNTTRPSIMLSLLLENASETTKQAMVEVAQHSHAEGYGIPIIADRKEDSELSRAALLRMFINPRLSRIEGFFMITQVAEKDGALYVEGEWVSSSGEHGELPDVTPDAEGYAPTLTIDGRSIQVQPDGVSTDQGLVLVTCLRYRVSD